MYIRNKEFLSENFYHKTNTSCADPFIRNNYFIQRLSVGQQQNTTSWFCLGDVRHNLSISSSQWSKPPGTDEDNTKGQALGNLIVSWLSKTLQEISPDLKYFVRTYVLKFVKLFVFLICSMLNEMKNVLVLCQNFRQGALVRPLFSKTRGKKC